MDALKRLRSGAFRQELASKLNPQRFVWWEGYVVSGQKYFVSGQNYDSLVTFWVVLRTFWVVLQTFRGVLRTFRGVLVSQPKILGIKISARALSTGSL